MKNTFTVNGITYVAKPFDFNFMCDLEDYGVDITKIGEKPMTVVRAYLAMCMGGTVEDAGKQMEMHVVSGGSFEGVMDAMQKEMEESDFFQALSKTAETTPQTVTEPKRKATAKK